MPAPAPGAGGSGERTFPCMDEENPSGFSFWSFWKAALSLFWNGFAAALGGQVTQGDVVTSTSHSGIAAWSQHSLPAKPLLPTFPNPSRQRNMPGQVGDFFFSCCNHFPGSRDGDSAALNPFSLHMFPRAQPQLMPTGAELHCWEIFHPVLPV